MTLRWLACALLVNAAFACARMNSTRPDTANLLFVCAEPRPEICTQHFDPVCARRDTGIRCVTTPCDSYELQTFPNGCSACSDLKVLDYRYPACASPQAPS